jgi:hypothetical protein
MGSPKMAQFSRFPMDALTLTKTGRALCVSMIGSTAFWCWKRDAWPSEVCCRPAVDEGTAVDEPY